MTHRGFMLQDENMGVLIKKRMEGTFRKGVKQTHGTLTNMGIKQALEQAIDLS